MIVLFTFISESHCLSFGRGGLLVQGKDEDGLDWYRVVAVNEVCRFEKKEVLGPADGL